MIKRIKFVHKRHIQEHNHPDYVIISYSMSDIFLGVLLVSLTGFIIYSYLEINLFTARNVRPATIVNLKK
jgi:hypothetical protein